MPGPTTASPLTARQEAVRRPTAGGPAAYGTAGAAG